MDYYYSSSPSMSSRGRFSSRGTSYRGSGRGDSSHRGSRGGYSSRGAYTSPRGRGSYYPKYETSGSKYSSETSKYSSHGRIEDNYRKTESSNYGSSRDHSHHRSEVEVGRKRMRNSYSQGQGTSSRRSHEVDEYRSGGSRYANTNSYTESRSYSDNRGDFKKPRVSEYKAKEEYRGRKEISRSSGQVSKARSFRGRTVRGRGIVRRGGESFLARKRASLSGSRRSASELLSLRRAKMLKLKRQKWHESAKLAHLVAFSLEEKKNKDGKTGEDEDNEDEEEDVEDEEEHARDIKMEDDDKKEEKMIEEKEKDKEDGEIDEKSDEKDKDKEKEKEKSKKSDDRIDFFGKPFMKLQCPQCSTKCITFREYIQHLHRATHVRAMREKSEQIKATLAKMRIAQRAKQKKADEEDVTNMSTRPLFCPICKLNYSHDKVAHQASEAHKKMKNILQPYCKTCHISLKSPMLYERHICTLDHLRRKHAMDERLGKNKGSVDYLDSFMVLDSVGSGDEVEDAKDDKEEDGIKKERDQRSNDENDEQLGAEYIHKVEVLYCEVCRTYLSNMIEEKRAIRAHCWNKSHLRCYLRFGSNKLLERIQGKEGKKAIKENDQEETEKGNEGKDKLNESGKETENHDESVEDEGGIDDRLWADVTELLNQVEPEPKSDDEDEEGGRFDRFKSNEKKENGEVTSPDDAEKDAELAPMAKESEMEVEKGLDAL